MKVCITDEDKEAILSAIKNETPFVISKSVSDTIRFSTENDKIDSLIINYYPVTIQAL